MAYTDYIDDYYDFPEAFLYDEVNIDRYSDHVYSEKIDRYIPDISQMKPKEEGCYILLPK